jgi:transketolase
MRKQLIKSVENLLDINPKTVLLLGDIGVFGFRNSFKKYPNRVYNIGILEQSTIGLAAGLSKIGLIPFVHTISPFIVERALEQLKIDFGYQNLNGNFLGIGASYDYSALGATHHCPSDISILQNIPNMQIIIPGSSSELDYLLNSNYNNGQPTYYKLAEYENINQVNVMVDKASIIKTGKLATVICFGNMLDSVLESTKDLDVTVLYYTTIKPFDNKILYDNFNEKIILIEQFYEGSMNYQINKSLIDKKYSIYNIGIRHEFLDKNGSKQDIDNYLGMDTQSIKEKIHQICIK